LIIVGSHVPRTSSQLAALRSQPGVVSVEVHVPALLTEAHHAAEVARVTHAIAQGLHGHADVVLFTSRTLVTGTDAARNLAIGQRVSAGLVAVIRALATRPRYVLAKGGITSSDIATQGLGVKRALVLGQILPGVPVWQLGAETRYPGLGYIVFPGNVGGPQARIAMLTSTTELLQAAVAGEYAIGAFNVYNLEGVRAVVSAAEAHRSPVILQLHPGALQHGGQPLVALCLAAAQGASVPITVHLDHSTSSAAIHEALEAGVTSVMADGSHLPYQENVAFTRTMVVMAHRCQAAVEAELGRLTGTEDGLTVPLTLSGRLVWMRWRSVLVMYMVGIARHRAWTSTAWPLSNVLCPCLSSCTVLRVCPRQWSVTPLRSGCANSMSIPRYVRHMWRPCEAACRP